MIQGVFGDIDKDQITKHVIKQYQTPETGLVSIPYGIAGVIIHNIKSIFQFSLSDIFSYVVLLENICFEY